MFIYAAYTKLRQSWLLFALSIDSYQMLPEWAVYAVARTLPWLELALGVLLATGVWLRYLSIVATAILGLFFTVMLVSYFRGAGIDCGCFGVGEALSAKTLLRDGVLLAAAISLVVDFREELRLLHNIGLHRAERAEQLILLGLPDLELVERADEILDQRVEIGAAHTHPHVRRLHVLAGVLARAAARLADLVDKVLLERLQPLGIGCGLGEEAVDAFVGRDAATNSSTTAVMRLLPPSRS